MDEETCTTCEWDIDGECGLSPNECEYKRSGKMTNQEAIQELKSYMPKDNEYNVLDREAFNMAIKSLENNERTKIIDEVIELLVINHGYSPNSVIVKDIRKLKKTSEE